MIRLRHVGLRREGASDGAPPGAGGRAALLDDISLDVPAGAFRWLLGPSGAGKTSLLRIIAMGERPTSGSVSLFGTETAGQGARRREAPKLRRRIGVVHQDFRLLPELSLFDNVALPLRLGRRREAERHPRADQDRRRSVHRARLHGATIRPGAPLEPVVP